MPTEAADDLDGTADGTDTSLLADAAAPAERGYKLLVVPEPDPERAVEKLQEAIEMVEQA